ncbi:unnamed protein product, partial [Urochloa humidicola]
ALFVFDGSLVNVENPLEILWPCFVNSTTADLEITCRCDEAAMEVMWGVENLLHILVPNEEIELRGEDHKLRSQGLHMFLQSLGYNIEKELVNGQIAETPASSIIV